MIKKNFYRYEKKFILNSFFINNINELENFLSIRLKENFNERRINSIYYDTHNYQLAVDTVNGISNRQKIRIRYYGTLEEFNSPKLEIKSKTGGVGGKEIFDLNKDKLYQESFSLNQFYKVNSKDRKTLYLVSLEPKVIVTYKRKYFLSSCERFRFTLDSDISFKKFDINISDKNFNKDNLYPFTKTILELKYKLENEFMASQIFKNLPARISSFSKYLTALHYLNYQGNIF